MKNIHIIATDKPSRLSDCHNGNLHLDDVRYLRNYQNIYITSDEEIKEGDWYLYGDEILKSDKLGIFDVTMVDICKKIILTTDKNLINEGVQAIDDEFLEWFIKNPSCEYAIVDKEEDSYKIFIPTINIENEIIIPKEESKQETLEEKLNKIVSKEPSKFWKESAERQSKRMEQLIELLKQTTEYEVSQKFRDKVDNNQK